MEIIAPSKINLFLNVVGKRNDGYHEVETILQRVNLADSIILKRMPHGIKIHCDNKDIPADERNLAYQAANILLDYSKTRRNNTSDRGVEIEIIKKIPVAAGLGGGSSDAAATLLGLNELWELELNQEVLIQLACKLGADVPFFLEEGSISGSGIALGKGRGDELTKLNPLPKIWLILVIPHIKVSTAWVYKNLKNLELIKEVLPDTPSSDRGKMILFAVQKGDIKKISQLLYNTLEDVTITYYPIIAQIKNDLLDVGAKGVLMSGSGPSVFGIFFGKQDAQEAYNNLTGDNISIDEQIRYILTSAGEINSRGGI